ncbi:DUF4870 domain-containing protein [Cellulophaga sp. E16_2]|uniref:DUF4870 domain-containing protein n=1 Tax=unclassified Cellulophaga TaxID=2634405 RepID=UPI0013FDCC9F|nr:MULTISPECIES: DUF4870 domain-containing protein [unclassified Cellulophaga]MBO0593106.1 DUF4870 domain-containing protein [Cellulophaga sp. E16_2]
MDQTTKEAGKTMAIISYVTLIGTLIAYFSNQGDKKNEFVTFHIGQAVRIWILSIIISIAVFVLILVTSIGALSYLSYAPWILAVLGAMNANNLKAEPVPVIGTIGG